MPQQIALAHKADQRHAERADQNAAPKAENRHCREGKIGTQHIERRMGEVQNAHHAKDERETGADHEEQEPVDHPVQQRDNNSIHIFKLRERSSWASPTMPSRVRSGQGRTILHSALTGTEVSSALSSLTGWKPMSVPSSLCLASFNTMETTSGSCS